MRSRSVSGIAAAAAVAIAGAACDTNGVPMEPIDEVVAVAPELSPVALLDDLELDPGQRAAVEKGVEKMHAALVRVHGMWRDDVEFESEEAREAFAAELHGAMDLAHELHRELFDSLTGEERDRLIRHVHEAMLAHETEMAEQGRVADGRDDGSP